MLLILILLLILLLIWLFCHGRILSFQLALPLCFLLLLLVQLSPAFFKTVVWFSHEISLYTMDYYRRHPATRRREDLLVPGLL